MPGREISRTFALAYAAADGEAPGGVCRDLPRLARAQARLSAPESALTHIRAGVRKGRVRDHPSDRIAWAALDFLGAGWCGPTIVSAASIAELSNRPSRPPDHAAENGALVALAQAMAASPDSILQRLADTALTLCRAHSSGLSLLEDGDGKRNFHWRAVAGVWAEHLGGGTPRDFGPCGTVLDRNVALLFSHPERDFPYFGEVKPLLEDGLLMPLYVHGEAIGTIWVVSHDDARRFDTEDLRVMTNLATFAGAAYQTLWSLKSTMKAKQELEQSAAAMQQAQEQLSLLLREMSHRVKNLFAITSSLVTLSARSARTPRDMADAVQERLAALNRAHELTRPGLTGLPGSREATTLHELVRTIFAPYIDKRAERMLLQDRAHRSAEARLRASPSCFTSSPRMRRSTGHFPCRRVGCGSTAPPTGTTSC